MWKGEGESLPFVVDELSILPEQHDQMPQPFPALNMKQIALSWTLYMESSIWYMKILHMLHWSSFAIFSIVLLHNVLSHQAPSTFMHTGKLYLKLDMIAPFHAAYLSTGMLSCSQKKYLFWSTRTITGSPPRSPKKLKAPLMVNLLCEWFRNLLSWVWWKWEILNLGRKDIQCANKFISNVTMLPTSTSLGGSLPERSVQTTTLL